MNNGDVRTQKALCNLKPFKLYVVEAAVQQPRVIFLEISSAMEPGRAHGHKVYVIGHDLRELVAIVLVKGRTEGPRQVVNSLLIGLRLGVRARDGSQR